MHPDHSFTFKLCLLLCVSALAATGHAETIDNGAIQTLPPSLRGADVTVGPDAGCDFNDLQTAINNAVDGDVLHLAAGLDHSGRSYGVFFAGPSFTIRGGYPDCDAGSTPSGRTVIDTAGSSSPVFDIWFNGAGAFRQINLENLAVKGSNGANAAGLLVEGRVGQLQVNLSNVEISGNQRTGGTTAHGAGLRILTTDDTLGGGPLVTVDNDSIIADNTAAGDGGGIHCQSSHDNGSSTVLRVGKTPIFNNQASNGGGIAVDGCQNVYLYSGGAVVLFFPTGGIALNNATGNGGGIHVSNGGEVFLRGRSVSGFGDPDHAALLIGNTADTGGGGALVRDPGSILHLEDTFVVNNSADLGGGGLRVINGGQVEVRRQAGTTTCEPVDSGGGVLVRPPCSVVENNSASSGGAVSLSGDSRVDISRTFVRNNQSSGAGTGQFAYVGNPSIYEGPASTLRIESSVITGHDGVVQELGNNAKMDIRWSTIAGNAGGVLARLISGSGKSAAIYTRGVVIDHDATLFLLQGSGPKTVSGTCVVSNQPITDYTYRVAVSQIDPGLRNPGAGDFHLANNSPAIDTCVDNFAPDYPDLDGNTRGQAWTGPEPIRPPNYYTNGLFDMGAYEASWAGDAIFSDRFESTAP